MEFLYLRQLLEDTEEHLHLLFEHGFSGGAYLAEEFSAISERFNQLDMEEGKALSSKLSSQLHSVRLNTEWNAEEVSQTYAELWRYLTRSKHYLDYLETRSQLS